MQPPIVEKVEEKRKIIMKKGGIVISNKMFEL